MAGRCGAARLKPVSRKNHNFTIYNLQLNNMFIDRELKNFKISFDREIARFLDIKIREAGKISLWAARFTEDLKSYMTAGGGGKRLRPALMYFGYLALGGKNKKAIIRAAMSTEFLHACFLIQDAIIARADLRHGEKTMHYRYKEWAKNNLNLNDAECHHYGISQAICLSDIALGSAFSALSESFFLHKFKIKAINKLNSMVCGTAVGEMSDMLAEDISRVNEGRVINILEYKTARYTVEGPLHLGAILAGADKKTLKSLSDFSIPLGIAFQIQDDILGVFGSSKETGKPVGADIREGKKTLLIVKALEMGSAEQKKELRKALRNHKASAMQIEKARKIIIDTGSLEYSQKLAEKLVDASRRALARSKLNKKSEEFFASVAGFMIRRKK